MALDDRDYMRERRRAESKAARLGSAAWIDKKGRVEHHGLWFDATNIGHDYRKHRSRGSTRVGTHGWQKWILLLSATSILLPLYGEAKRKGWVPDFSASMPFPETGSVTIAAPIKRLAIRSRLTIQASEANAVVQLFDPKTNRHIFSVYVASSNRITVPVPIGTFRMRLVEGQKWHGTTRYFGPNTTYETVAEFMTFDATSGHTIDLNRRPDGNLPTRLMVTSPEPI